MNFRLILGSMLVLVVLSGCSSSTNATVDAPARTTHATVTQATSSEGSSSGQRYSAPDGPPNTDLAREEYLEMHDIDPESVEDDEVYADLDADLDAETEAWEDAEREREADEAFFDSE